MSGKPRVLIDASPLIDQVDGLSVYTIGLLKHLPEQAFEEFEFSVLYNPGLNRPDFAAALANKPFQHIVAKIHNIGPKRDWDLFWFLRRQRGSFDLFHSTSHNYPLALRGGVCTVHDLTWKKYFDPPKGIIPAKLATAYLNLVVRHALKRADAIIAVSESTKRELLSHFDPTGRNANKVRVIYEGWEHLQDYEGLSCEEFPYQGRRYLFSISSHRVHKNIDRLLEGFEIALPSIPANVILLVAGTSDKLSQKGQESLGRVNGSGERAVFAGYIKNACIPEYYRNAGAFILPSLSEGFGLPVLEAFYFGVPLLCSNSTSLPEVAGDAAIYFDPHSSEAIASALVEFYARPGRASQLAESGRARKEQFSWATAAAQTLDLYRHCLQR